jgi:hypothetical protein
MSFADDLKTGIGELQAELGQTFTWNGKDYGCIRRLTRKGNDPTEGGTWLTAIGSLTVLREILPSIPKEGNTITVSGSNYIIISVGDDENIPFVQIQYGKVPKP